VGEAMSDMTAQLIAAAPIPPTANPQLLAAALRCLERGWYVFPLAERSKSPDGLLAPHGFNSSSNDPDQIRSWWTSSPNANVGVDLGRSNLTVLDFDAGEPPADIGLPLTLTVRTGRGLHVYLQGRAEQTRMHFAGKHIGEIKSAGGYVLSPYSIHPNGSTYSVVSLNPISPIPPGLIERVTTVEEKPAPIVIGGKIPRGSHDIELTRIGGRLRNDGLEEIAIGDALIEVCEKRCENYGSDYREMCRKIAKSVCKYSVGKNTALQLRSVLVETESTTRRHIPVEIVDDLSVDTIPPFEPDWVTGIYKKFVDLITVGTTMTPQFAYLAAKVVVGARMAGKVKFEDLDVEPRYYGALIGETGSGKGEAWRRMMQILNAEGLVHGASGGCHIKIINSADSGAGLKEYFFDPPEDQPVICYVDEVEGLGNKATATRNPAILDTIIELADSTSISRTLAKKRRTKNNARLSMFMCGQDGDTYMKAFAGRTKLGMYDRLYPEFGCAVAAGDLPPIAVTDAYNLLQQLNKLDYSSVMTIRPDAKVVFGSFWNSQPKEVRNKARWKRNAMLDAYIIAFGRGSKEVTADDMDIAIRLLQRQLVIRKVCFRSEVPDKVGFYLGKIKDITNQMVRQLSVGQAEADVALSRRDYERKTNAYRDNEEHFFERAWSTHSRVHLRECDVRKANGQTYKKYLPIQDG
jgi:Bifunctional DNA primase/polymerase, N-terminal